MELLGKGLNPPEIAEKLDCSLSSVYYWDGLRKKHGDEALKSKPIPGRPEKLNARRRHSLTRILVKGAMENGYSTDLWTLRRISEVIDKQFDVSYHPAHVWKLLRELGWSCQKPETKARERDEKKIKQRRLKNSSVPADGFMPITFPDTPLSLTLMSSYG